MGVAIDAKNDEIWVANYGDHTAAVFSRTATGNAAPKRIVRNEPAGTLPYGLRKRIELARAIAIEPELILLDEPMAGMNLEEKEDMARYVVDLNQELGMTIIMIEHDMGVVMDISHRVMVLDFGRKISEGSPEQVLADEHVKRAYLGEDDEVLHREALEALP